MLDSRWVMAVGLFFCVMKFLNVTIFFSNLVHSTRRQLRPYPVLTTRSHQTMPRWDNTHQTITFYSWERNNSQNFFVFLAKNKGLGKGKTKLGEYFILLTCMRCITLIRSIISFPSLLLSISAAGIGKGTGGYFIFALCIRCAPMNVWWFLMLHFTPFM